MDISASIVLYDNKKEMIDKVVKSFFSSRHAGKLYIIDHSGTDSAKYWYSRGDIEYIHEKNTGYGAGHNTALRKYLDGSSYHVILNPDVFFGGEVLDTLFSYCEQNPKTALVMPKILYPNGELQYLCKLLPTPLDWFIRRFIKSIKNGTFELRQSGYDRILKVPYLSGCFMFIRTKALKKVGLFDERYFLHCEDTDLCRRLHSEFDTIYYPKVFVFHEHQKESHKNYRMLRIHISSTIKYFNKWGWFFDSQRKVINKKTLSQLRQTTSVSRK